MIIINYPALLQYWDSSGKKIREIKASKAEYRNLRWSSNGTHLATASEKVRIWSKEGEEKLISKKITKGLLWGIDWNSSNNKLITTSGIGDIIVLNNELKIIKRVKN